MKKTYPIVLLLLVSLSALARPVDETTARQLALSFWKENNLMGVQNGHVFKMSMEDVRFANVAPLCGYTEFFIFNNLDGKGYVIIAGDDCVTPVLGYSYEHNFDPEILPPNLKAWLDGYAMQIRAAVAAKAIATDEIRTDWKCLREGKTLPIKSEKAVAPLIITEWSQSPYYNDKCPYDSNAGKRAVTGCVATAMAQVLKYWSYPEHGYGSHSYVPSSHPEYGTLYVDFSATNYQWSSMPNSVTSSNNAVATLIYHCGVSVNMDYSPNGSSSYTTDNGSGHPCAETALKSYFNYKSSLHSVSKSDYSDTQWSNLLKNELNNSRPMLYRGTGSNGGHAFICDGYNNNGYFHFNWGWSGHYNDYFYINNLNPNNHSFSSSQQAVIGIEPKQSSGGGGGGGGGGSSNSSYNLVYRCSLSATESEYWFYDNLKVYAEILNSGDADFYGYIGAGVFKKNENNEFVFVKVMKYWNRTSNPLHANYYVYGNLEGEGGPPFLPGSYGIAMLYSLDCDLWNFIDGGNYHDAFFDIVYSSAIETNSNFSIKTGDYLYYGTSSTVNVDIWNSSSSTFYGKFRISLTNLSDGSWAQNIAILNCDNGLQANYHYTNGRDFTGEITVEPGSYYMQLGYQKSGESTWYYAGASEFQNPIRVQVVAAPVSADPYEDNDHANIAYLLPCNLSGSSTTVRTTGSNLHNSTDVDYYKISLDPGRNYVITPRLYDSYNNGGSNTYYTVDASFAYHIDGNWSDFYDDVLPSSITFSGGTIYFCVMPYFEEKTGTYLLEINIQRGTGIDEDNETHFEVYPNPTSDFVTVSGNNIETIEVYNTLGACVGKQNANGHETIQVDLSTLPGGMYMLKATRDGHATTKRIVKM